MLGLSLAMTLGNPALNAGVGLPAGFSWLTLNGKYLTLNGKRLMLETA